MLGSRDMAFPHLNALSYVLFEKPTSLIRLLLEESNTAHTRGGIDTPGNAEFCGKFVDSNNGD